jgi:predicted amidohydrolase
VHKTDRLIISHRLIKEIQKSCKENSIWAIITDSFFIKKTPYEVALLIDRNGKIRGKYKKINLYADYSLPGKKIFVYQTDFAKIGIAVCWDLAHPEIFSRMKKSGAEIVFCPARWCYESAAHEKDHRIRELSIIRSLVKSRAFENLYFVAFANPVMDWKDLVPYSAIASPHKILAEIKDKEGLIYSKINLKEIQKFSKLYASQQNIFKS